VINLICASWRKCFAALEAQTVTASSILLKASVWRCDFGHAMRDQGSHSSWSDRGSPGARDSVRPTHTREREQVSIQCVGVRYEEPVRGVLVHPQRTLWNQTSGLAAAELQRRLKIVVAVNDQGWNSDRPKLVTEVCGEPCEKELGGRPR
jgi:hypothetical protein